jgi:hypothetical protein
LRWFARTPYARRAINSIKNPIALLDWEIVPMPGIDMNAELEKQAEIAAYCIDHPNGDDSARTLFEQVVEDVLLGAGAIEMQLSDDESRPLWMWPVDGLTIQIFPGWAGGVNEARYIQIVGYGNFVGNGIGQQVLLRNDELIYIRPNPISATPFGCGPLGLFLRFRAIPTPRSLTGRGANDADHRLPARVDVDVLHGHLTAGPCRDGG